VDASLGSSRAAPGDTITVAVRLEGRRDGADTRVIRLTIPKETPEGKAFVVVADGSNASLTKLGLEPSEPRSLRGLADWIDRLVPSDVLAALLLVPSRGASTGSATLTSLPPTAASLLAGNPEPGDVRDVKARLLAESTLSLGRPVAGVVKLEIEIERPRS